MKCIVCNGKAKVLNEWVSPYHITTRHYECVDCLTRFKTSEKILFESIPSYIRKRFIETGERP
jgi:transcriptional regulator NrdR family protein